MTRQLWLAAEPRRWGLNVVEVDGWQSRGSSTFNPGGLICHHTAGAATGELPSLRVLINGRSDLPGPLCNWALGRSGTVYTVASGRANHAGEGYWEGLRGNSALLGIEAESVGNGKDWTPEQLRVYPILAACAMAALHRDARYVAAHREYALPAGRKNDPVGIDMPSFRHKVADLLAAGPGSSPPSGVVMPEFRIHFDGDIVSRCYPEGGGMLMVTEKGQVIGIDTAVAKYGMPYGQPYFANRQAARIRNATPEERSSGVYYVVVATSGELYKYGT